MLLISLPSYFNFIVLIGCIVYPCCYGTTLQLTSLQLCDTTAKVCSFSISSEDSHPTFEVTIG